MNEFNPTNLKQFAEDDLVYISVDAEWYKNTFLMVQLAVSNKEGKILQYYVFVDRALPFEFKTYKDIPTEVINYPIGKKGIMEYFTEVPMSIHCFFFYSPRDIEGLIGAEEWTKLLVGSKVEKTRNLNIKPYPLVSHGISHTTKRGKEKVRVPRIYFKDLSGRFGCSLEKAYNLVNIDISRGKAHIHNFNVDKSRMDMFLEEHPREFLEYSLGDLELHLLALRLKDLMNEVLKECFGIENMYRSLFDYPSTVGSMVNDIFIRFLHENYPDVLRSTCFFSTTSNDKCAENLENSLSMLDRDIDGYKVTHNIINKKGIVHGLGACSIPAFFPGNYGANNTSAYGAVVQGGRAIKEDNQHHIYHNILDIDLSSAYGSSLNRFDYPFGLPTVVAASNHTTQRITLKEFLSKHKEDLVDKLYVIYVEGMLNHQQDLVFSKYGLNTTSIYSKLLVEDYDEEDSFGGRIGGDFLLTSQQLELGIITSDILDVLKKICTNKEWSDWMNLKVTLAVYYPKSLELSLEEWSSRYNSLNSVGIKTDSEDNRSRYWCRFPLEKFIGRLISMRKFYKSKKDEHPSFESKQLLLKLITNTIYGDLASPHFAIGNTVLANNITASVRTGSWIMSKALGCKFIVTDGGIYEFNSIPLFKTHLNNFRKPGLQSLLLKDKRWMEFVGTQPLSKDIDNLESFLLEDKYIAGQFLDKKALEVIRSFCSIYDLDFFFKIEHKIDNSASIAVTNPFGKVDYILYTYWNEEVIRIRGVKSSEHDNHPKVEALRALKDNRPLRFHGAILYQLIGVNEYIKNPSRFNKDLPGYEISLEYIYKPNKSGGNVFKTWEEHHKAKDAHRKRVAAYDKKYKHVELLLKPSFL